MTTPGGDRIQVLWTGTGSSTMTLGAATTPKTQAVPAALDGQYVSYLIDHQTENEIEAGFGLYTHSGTTLSRLYRTYPTLGGSPVSFSPGDKWVSITPIARDVLPNISTSDPTATDDITAGHKTGMLWINSSTPAAFLCVDPAEDNAIWVGPLLSAADLGLVAFSNDYNDLDNTPLVSAQGLVNVDITAATHQPVRGNRYKYAPSGGSVVIILDDNGSFVEPGVGQLERVSGSARIVPASGKTLNGSTRVSLADAISDAVWTGASGLTISITSAGSNIADRNAGDIGVVTSSGVAANNGIYLVGATHTTSNVALTKLANSDGSAPTNPSNASSESITINWLSPINLISLATIWLDGNDFSVQGGTDSDKDFDGSNISGMNNVVVTGSISGNGLIAVTASGSLASHCGKRITTSGGITIPNTQIGDGWWQGLIEVGANTHDWTFNGLVLDISVEGFAAGDLCSVVVKSASVIDISGPPGVFTEADFS